MNVRRFIRPGLLLALVPFTLTAQSSGDPPARVARISSLLGPVSFQAAGLADWSSATLNYTVTTGDRLLTGQGARTELEVGPFAVRLADTTDLSVVNLTDNFMQLGLAQGTLRLSVYRVASDDSVEIDTPNGALIIRSPGQYRVEAPLNGSSTFVSVDDGNLELNGPGVDERLHRGQTVELTGSNPIRLTYIPRQTATAFDRWAADRDLRQEASTCSRYVSQDIPGCADLSDHGRWDEHTIYGPVWYPSRVPVGWVPYRYGRWVWVEPWGWTWVEDEPWGFAPFHYGRWVMVGAVWAWAPGPIVRRPYYAPAFVTFVGGPRYGFGVSIGVHAWFPLGPREPYYPWYHHGDRYLREVNSTNVRNVTNINIFVDSRNADHFHYAYRDRATTVVSNETFRTGRPVAREMVRVRDEDLARAPVVDHPWVTPAERAAVGGRLDAHTQAPARPQLITAWHRADAAPDQRPTATRSPDVRETPAQRTPLVTRNTPPDRNPTVNPVRQAGSQPDRARPVESQPNQTRTVQTRSADTRPTDVRPQTTDARNGRVLITRSQPPAETPSFDARERAMRQDPGRPLDPQQMDNVRRAQTSGTRRDAEPSSRQSGSTRQGTPPARESAPAQRSAGGTASRKPPR